MTGAWESQAERVALGIATDRWNLIWVMPAQGETSSLKESSGTLAHANVPFSLLNVPLFEMTSGSWLERSV